MAIDPYRILGLPPGSSAADVKRAYRRLAKANHPDSAGAAALPRFLEIQRAYETLTTVTWRPGMRRPAPSSPSEPWRADQARARSTQGAQPPRGTQGPRPAGASGTAGSAGGRARASRQTAAGAGQTAAGAGSASSRPGATSGTGGKAGSGARKDGSTGASGGTGRRRTSKKATFGSTTYDEAREGSDTTWSGASWYGPSSGEYWRVNPREYADPRKHGPEYLAKAAARAAAAAERRAQQAGAPDPGTASTDDSGAAEGAAGGSGAGRERREQPVDARRQWSSRAERARHPDEHAAGALGSDHPSDGPNWTPRSPDTGIGSAGEAAAAGPPPAWAVGLPNLNLGPGMRRVVRALIAWPPLGIAAAAVIGEATGCAAFDASCTAPADLYPWIAQAVIVLALLAVPGIARILAGGTIAVAVLAFPVAAVLSASGANYDRTYGPAALMSSLGIAWAIGVGAVLMRRAVTRGIP